MKRVNEKDTHLNSSESAMTKTRHEGRGTRAFSKDVLLFEVRSIGGCTLDMTPVFSECEETFTECRARADVLILNQRTGHKTLVYANNPLLNDNKPNDVSEEVKIMRRKVSFELSKDSKNMKQLSKDMQ